MDGRGKVPANEGGKVSAMAKDYAKMLQDCYIGPLRYLPAKELVRYNEYMQKLLDKRGEPEIGEMIVFAANRILNQDAMDRKKFSLYEFQGHVAAWDGSTTKEDWLGSKGRVSVPS